MLWNNTHEPNSNIKLMHSSIGKWTPTAACPAPKLWVYLFGHVNTLHFTKLALASMAKESSGDCYMVAAVVPQVGWRG